MPRLRTLAFALAALAASAFLHLRSPNVPDPDSFYHIRHAALYAANGPFMTEFPWIAWSIIRVHAADIWYGFHLLLVPFSAIADPVLAVKLPGILLTVLLLLSVQRAMLRLGVAHASFWPFLLLVAGPNVLLHFTMMRPHVLTTGMCALLFACLVQGSSAAVFAASLAITFFHLSQFWMIPAIVLPVLAAKVLCEGSHEGGGPIAARGRITLSPDAPHPVKAPDSRANTNHSGGPGPEHAADVCAAGGTRSVGAWARRPADALEGGGTRAGDAWARAARALEWRKGLGALAGLLAGWLLRPHPLGAAKIAYVQIVEHTLVRRAGVPLVVGKELMPITADVLVLHFVPFLVLWAGACALVLVALGQGLLARVEPRMKTLLASSFVLSLVFFLMMLFLARRSFAPWVLFAVFFVAGVATCLVERRRTSPVSIAAETTAPSTEHIALSRRTSRERESRGPRASLGSPGAGRTLGSARVSPGGDEHAEARPGALRPEDPAVPGHESSQASRRGGDGAEAWSWPGSRARVAILGGTAVLCAVMLGHATLRTRKNLADAIPADSCKEAAEWIAARSRPGDIVYNLWWDSFPGLFLWNQKNRYVSGMDPIFLYAYDPALYYKSFYIQIGKATAVTCGAGHCSAETLEDTYTVLRRDFDASWIFLEKDRNPAFYAWLKSDPRFVPGFENARQAVFGLGGSAIGDEVVMGGVDAHARGAGRQVHSELLLGRFHHDQLDAFLAAR